MTDRRRDAWGVFGIALLVRLAVVVWARGHFPPTADGYYYDILARRLASGAGYTWLWPDGAVTYAAHYPVGFPALLAAAYAMFGASDTVAMTLSALLGAASAYASHRIVDSVEEARWRPVAAGLAVALHPALVPYTAARMTEAVTAALLLVATAIARRGRSGTGWISGAGTAVVMALATLVRPQSLALVPILGGLSLGGGATLRRRAVRATVVTLVALACLAPWTARNCIRMRRCAVVSLNEGWNLLIGATTTSGGWQPVSVPPECGTVWDEAEKDRCFKRAAVTLIRADPKAWLARAPSKVAMTLDYFGAAPWYLHASNPAAFGSRSQVALATVETVLSRLFLVGALVACGRFEGPRGRSRRVAALLGVLAALTLHASMGYLAIVVCVALLGWRAVLRMPLVVPTCASVVVATVVVHAAFFGAGRYGLVVAPFVAALGFVGSRSGTGILDSPCAPPPTGAS